VFIRAVTSGLLLGVPLAASPLSTTTVRHIGWLTPGPLHAFLRDGKYWTDCSQTADTQCVVP
jgi:hypothetical protein